MFIGKLFVLVPVYNEGRGAAALVARFPQLLHPIVERYEIVVIDDGSTDESVPELEKIRATCPFTLIAHKTNRGLRDTLQTGLTYIGKIVTDQDVIVLLDGDDTHDPCHIKEMLSYIAQGADVVIASRYRPGATITGLSFIRRQLSRGAAVLGAVLFRIRGVRDYTCGYRAIRGASLRSLIARFGDRIFETGAGSFICSVELLLKLSLVATHFAEVPIKLHYERKQGLSKMRTFRMIRDFFTLWYCRRTWTG